jgi:hypothetical protein
MGIREVVELFKMHIMRYKSRNEGFALNNDPIQFSSSMERAASVIDRDFAYGPNEQTKKELLQDPHGSGMVRNGWQMLFLQAYDNKKAIQPIYTRKEPLKPWNSSGTNVLRHIISDRKSPVEYATFLQDQATSHLSPYQGESGMTLESWIIACIDTLNQRDRMLDSVYFEQGRGNFCIDSRTANTAVSSTYRVKWLSTDEEHYVVIVREPMTKADPTTGLRTEVRV